MDIMSLLSHGAEHFIGVFQAGGQTFVGFVTGILPTLIVLLTAVYAVIELVGEQRIHGLPASRRATSSPAIHSSLCLRSSSSQTQWPTHSACSWKKSTSLLLSFGNILRASDHGAFPAREFRRVVRIPWRCTRHTAASASLGSPCGSLLLGWSCRDLDPRHRYRVDHSVPRAPPERHARLTAPTGRKTNENAISGGSR